MSVPKIVEITYAIYQGLSAIRLCREYVGRKVNNASGPGLISAQISTSFPGPFPWLEKRSWERGCRNFAFACSSSLSPRVITCFESAIQSKTHYLVSGQLKKPRGLSPRYGHVIMVSGYLALTVVN